ncbi:MAG: hypothetical protein U9R50_04755 [Campylobacterota bacterium]|nr:hypothetical protein [Campylobacterota bacterium]
MAEAIVLTMDQKMALMSMESKAKQKTALDIFNEFTKMGLSQEVVSALKEISIKTAKDIAGKTIEIGKIIVMKIIDFIKENPGLAIGAAIGGAIGALSFFIPFIGAFVGPIGTYLGAGIGGLIGNKIQNTHEGKLNSGGLAGEIENAMNIAKKFFNLLKEIFLSIFRPEELK